MSGERSSREPTTSARVARTQPADDRSSDGVTPGVSVRSAYLRRHAWREWRGGALDRHLLVAAFCTFVLLLVLLALRHEPWRDEWQAWVIARDSSSLADVLHNARYEGHPPLWYVVLWLASRLSRHVLTMQLLNAAIGALMAAVVLWRAPFRRAARIAIIFGYFPLYEYGTIARSYALGVLLLVITLAIATELPRRPLKVAVPLGLMMLTSAHAMLVGIALACGLLVDGAVAAIAGQRPVPRRRSIVAAAALLVVCAAVALVQILPPSDAGFGVGLSTPADARSQTPLFAELTVSMFIGNKQIPTGPAREALAAIIGAVVLAVVAWGVRRRPGALTLWLGANALLLGLAQLRFGGSMRHWGHLYLAAIATFWLAESCCEWRAARPVSSPRHGRVVTAGAVLVLSTQVLFGLRAAYKDVLLPYSATGAAAAWIREHDLVDAKLIGSHDEVAMTVAANLDRPMLLLDERRIGTFVLWRNDWRRATSEEIVTAAEDHLAAGLPVVVVTTGEVRDPTEPLHHVGSFVDSIVGEQVHLYVARPGG